MCNFSDPQTTSNLFIKALNPIKFIAFNTFGKIYQEEFAKNFSLVDSLKKENG
jgi:hypothetical protein